MQRPEIVQILNRERMACLACRIAFGSLKRYHSVRVVPLPSGEGYCTVWWAISEGIGEGG